MKHSTRPSQRAIHTRRTSFLPRRFLDITTTKSGTPFRKAEPKSSGTQSYRLLRRAPTHVTVTEHSHWFRGRNSLYHCLGTHSTVRSSQVRRWCRQLSRGGEDATLECIHYANLGQRRYTPIPSYIPPMGAWSMSSESILLSRGGIRRLGMVRMCRAGRQAGN